MQQPPVNSNGLGSFETVSQGFDVTIGQVKQAVAVVDGVESRSVPGELYQCQKTPGVRKHNAIYLPCEGCLS